MKDTIVVPAHPKGCKEVFLGERRWPNLKIDRRRKEQIKFIAVYQTKPISAITHYAKIKEFQELKHNGRYSVIFDGVPKEIEQVRYTQLDVCAIQGPRYTNLGKIINAKRLDHAF